MRRNILRARRPLARRSLAQEISLRKSTSISTAVSDGEDLLTHGTVNASAAQGDLLLLLTHGAIQYDATEKVLEAPATIFLPHSKMAALNLRDMSKGTSARLVQIQLASAHDRD